MNPQELGQVIVNLQDEIKIIKLQMENLPGYDIGKSPLQLNLQLLYRRGPITLAQAESRVGEDI